MSKKKIVVFLVFAIILAGMLVGCNSLNYNKVKKSIFTEGDYVCLPNEDGTVTILELSEQGKEKEVLVIPETIGGKKVVSLGGRIYGGSLIAKETDRFRVFASEKLKKLYLLFSLEDQYPLYDSDREYCEYIVNIPNAVIVGPAEAVVTYANKGFLCKGVTLTKDRVSLYDEAGFRKGAFLGANLLYCDDESSGGKILWFDYVDDTVPAGYLPDFPGKKTIVSWRVKSDGGTSTWDGIVRPGLTLTACYGFTDGQFWGNYSYTGDFYVFGLTSGTTVPEKLIVPSIIDGKEVRGIEQGAFSGLSMREVAVADTVKVISNGAFADCANLEKITFGPDSRCEELYSDAFKNCVSLTSFTAPDSLKKIWGAFSGCSALTTIDLKNCVWYSVSDGCTALKEFKTSPSNVNLIVDQGVALYMISDYGKWLVSFAPDADLTSYVVESDCDAVYLSAFADNEKLQKVSGGKYFLQLYESAFKGCSALKEVDFKATSVSAYAFQGCVLLEKVYLRGNGNVFYGPDCFKDTPDTCSLYVPDSKVDEVRQGKEAMGFSGNVYAIEEE